MSQNVDKPNNLQKLSSKYFRIKTDCASAQYAPLVLATKGHKCCPVNVKRRNRQYIAPSNWAQMTPYEVIRKNNCKSYQFFSKESYPSIRPTQYICSESRTAQDVLNAVVKDCGRYFRMEKDDIVDMWKQSPDKDTLGFYGIDTESQQEDADAFNKLVSKCLKKVAKKVEEPPKIRTVSKKPKKETEDLCDGLVLNHMLLQRKVYTMPTVQKKISAINALKTMHCPSGKSGGTRPFVKNKYDGFFNLKSLHDGMEKSVSKKKPRRRRKHRYSDLNSVIPENESTYLEWLKYKNDPKPFATAFNEEMEMEEMQKQQIQATEPEPKNYEELYEQLMECFENNQLDPLCEAYKACCLIKRKADDEVGADGERDHGPKIEVPKKKKFPKIEQKKKREDVPDEVIDETEKVVETEKGDVGKDKRKKSRIRRKKSSTLWEEIPPNEPLKTKKKTDKPIISGSSWEEIPPNKSVKDKEKTRTRKSDKGGKDGTHKGKTGEANLKKSDSTIDSTQKVSDKRKSSKEKVKKSDSTIDSTQKVSDKRKSSKEKVKKSDRKDKSGKYDKSDSKDSDVTVTDKHKDRDKDRTSSTDREKHRKSSSIKDKGKGKVGKKHKNKPNASITDESSKEDISKNEKVEIPKIDIKKKKLKKLKLPEKPKEPVKVVEPVKDCPCKICEFMRRVSSDNLLIKKLKDEEKRRQLRDYYKEMCQRNRAKNEQLKCPAPQRKTEPIDFDNDFCCNPKLSEYSNCLKGMHELKKQLKCKYSNKDEVMSDMQNLIERMSTRFLECLN